MYEWLCKYFLKKTVRDFQITLAKDILEEIQNSADYNISNKNAEKIIESIVKSSGNKITDFILKD